MSLLLVSTILYRRQWFGGRYSNWNWTTHSLDASSTWYAKHLSYFECLLLINKSSGDQFATPQTHDNTSFGYVVLSLGGNNFTDFTAIGELSGSLQKLVLGEWSKISILLCAANLADQVISSILSPDFSLLIPIIDKVEARQLRFRVS